MFTLLVKHLFAKLTLTLIVASQLVSSYESNKKEMSKFIISNHVLNWLKFAHAAEKDSSLCWQSWCSKSALILSAELYCLGTSHISNHITSPLIVQKCRLYTNKTELERVDTMCGTIQLVKWYPAVSFF